MTIFFVLKYLTHPSIHSFVHCFVGSSIHCMNCDSLIRWLIDSVVHCSCSLFMHSLIHRFIDSFRQLCMVSFMSFSLASQPPFAHWLMHLTTSTLHGFLHLKKYLYRPCSSRSGFICFSKLPPRHGPGNYLFMIVCCFRSCVYDRLLLVSHIYIVK